MPEKKKSWILTDVRSRIWEDSVELSGKDLGLKGFPGAFVRKHTLHGGLCDGVDIVEVNNGAFSFVVLPTRGMGIWRGEYKGNEVGWKAPINGPVHPKFVHQNERSGIGWLAGFDEMVVRCGLESNGGPGTDVLPNNTGEPTPIELTLHGRIANIPAHYVEVSVTPGDPPQICVSGVVDESMLFSPQFRLTTRITTEAGSNAFAINDEITNMRSTTGEMELLYHCNFGRPFMEEGARLLVPVSEIAPRDSRAAADIASSAVYGPPTPGYIEQCFWHVPLADAGGSCVALLENAARDKGIAVRFNVGRLPCFTQWKNAAAESDGYVTGLEPGTNYPNSRTFERQNGRVVNMAPGARYTAGIVIEAHSSADGVKKVEKEIAAIQKQKAPRLHKQPQARYSPV